MDFRELAKPYQTGPGGQDFTPENQVKWLRRLGFPNDVIDRAMIAVYTEVEQGTKRFPTWEEFNLCLRETARNVQTKDLRVYVNRLQDFEAKLKKKWAEELPWWKRWLGIKK